MRIAVVVAIVLGVVSIAAADPAQASLRKPTNIPAQSLVTALQKLSQERQIQMVYLSDAVGEVRTSGAVGELTADEAIRLLLSGTGLTYKYLDDNTITVQRRDSAKSDEPSAWGDTHSPQTNTSGSPPVSNDHSGVPAKSFWDRLRVAQAASPSRTQPASVDSPAASSPQLGEIIVTASKRPQELREVANSVTAFSGDDLSKLGAHTFADYLGRAPGVQFQASTPGVANVTIRGIGTATSSPDQGQATTGIYLNDVPLTDPGFAVSVPDLDVFDVERVEVLRGPQGTLFGSATLGGAVNYILKPVDLSNFDTKLEASSSGTRNASKMGYAAKAAVNIPIVSDVFGVRLTALHRHEPGYIDNIGIGDKDANSHDVDDFRLNGLWQISDQTRLAFLSFYETSENDDGYKVFRNLPGMQRDTFVGESWQFKHFVNNLRLDTDLPFATLTLTGATANKAADSLLDYTPYFGGIPTTSPAYARTRTRMGEIRLTSATSQRLEWLLGLYYGRFHEDYPTPLLQEGVDVFDFAVNYRSSEKSVFGEATWHFNEQWRLTAGGRQYDIRQQTETLSGVPGTPPDRIAGEQKQTGFSPKASLTFEPSRSLMVYALVSKGFRMGGVNLVAPLNGFATPETYDSDSVVNYELGIRASWLDRTLLLDSTVFTVDWTKIQLRLFRPDGFAYATNAGKANSTGIENSLTWQPVDAFGLNVSATYLDAKLTEDIDLGNGTLLPENARIPGAAKWSVAESVNYRWPTPYHPEVVLSHRYISRSYSSILGGLPTGNYNVIDVSGRMQFRNLGVTLYGENLADKRGVTTAAFFGGQVTEYLIRPRTVGLRLDWSL